MRRLMTSTILTAALAIGGAGTALAQDCGSVAIASMNWQSGEVLAALDQIILQAGYGCDTEIVAGDTVPTLTSMIEKGQPDVVPEGWTGLVPELVNPAIADGRLVSTVPALADGAVLGWYVPQYIADAHPEIKTIDDALAHPDLFPAPEDPSKGAVHNGPQGWGASNVMAQLFKAYKAADKGFVLVDPGSAAGLDGALIKAYEQQEGWLGYYWEPTSVLGKYQMVKLSHGVPYDEAEWNRCTAVPECGDPKPNDWPGSTVVTLVTGKFAQRASPQVMDYFKVRSWHNATVNKLLAWMDDNQATGAEGARHFLKTNEEIWTKWVTPDAAEKIKATLK